MKHRREIGFCVMLAIMTLVSCSPSRTPATVGAARIDVFPGSRLVETDRMQALEGYVGHLANHTTEYWSFETDASAQEIMEYYVSKYPKLESTVAADEVVEGHFELEWLSGGINSIEGISLWIQDGEFEIGETIRD